MADLPIDLLLSILGSDSLELPDVYAAALSCKSFLAAAETPTSAADPDSAPLSALRAKGALAQAASKKLQGGEPVLVEAGGEIDFLMKPGRKAIVLLADEEHTTKNKILSGCVLHGGGSATLFSRMPVVSKPGKLTAAAVAANAAAAGPVPAPMAGVASGADGWPVTQPRPAQLVAPDVITGGDTALRLNGDNHITGVHFPHGVEVGSKGSTTFVGCKIENGLSVKVRGSITLIGCTFAFTGRTLDPGRDMTYAVRANKPGLRTGKQTTAEISYCTFASSYDGPDYAGGEPACHVRAEAPKEVSLKRCTFTGKSGGEVSVQFPGHYPEEDRTKKVSIVDCSFEEPNRMSGSRICFLRGSMPEDIIIKGNTFLGNSAVFVNNHRWGSNLLLENNNFVEAKGQDQAGGICGNHVLGAYNGVLFHVCGSPGLHVSQCDAESSSGMIIHREDCRAGVDFQPQLVIGSSEDEGGAPECGCPRCGDFRDWDEDSSDDDSEWFREWMGAHRQLATAEELATNAEQERIVADADAFLADADAFLASLAAADPAIDAELAASNAAIDAEEAS